MNNNEAIVKIDILTKALEELVGCAGLTALPGYKNELDAAVRQAHEALAALTV